MGPTNDITTILSSSVRLSVPLAFAATGEYVAERAGTLNISVEAMMPGAAFLLVGLIPFVWWLVQRSRFGLEIRAVGERPEAADVSGIEVNKRRRQAIYFCGAMGGLGGAYLAVGEVGLFNEGMTAGRGFIA